jgi:hypothetical protein
MRKFIPLILVSLIILSCPADDSGSGPAEISVQIPADFAGMCHSGGSNNLDREYEILNEMGVVWLHRDFSWSTIQPTEGTWNFSSFDSYVARGNAEGKKVMGMLLYDVKWVHDKFDFPNKRSVREEELPYYVNYAVETVKRYNGKHDHGKVDAWLIWNEPDLKKFWEGTKEEFFALTKETAEAIRELDAREGTTTTLAGGIFAATVLTDDKWITGLFDSGAMDHVDLVSVHPYTITAEGAVNMYNKFKQKVTPYGFADKIWINEMGYPTYSEQGPIPEGRYGFDQYEGDMPEVVIKTFIHLAAAGAKNLTWYHLFDSGDRDDRDSEDWFGLVWRKSADEWIKKGGYWGYALCANNIPGKTWKQKKFFSGKVSDSVQSYYFDGHDSGGKHTLIVWNKSPSSAADITINLKGSSHKLWDPVTGGSSNIDKNSTHTLNKANTGQKTLVFITWEE